MAGGFAERAAVRQKCASVSEISVKTNTSCSLGVKCTFLMCLPRLLSLLLFNSTAGNFEGWEHFKGPIVARASSFQSLRQYNEIWKEFKKILAVPFVTSQRGECPELNGLANIFAYRHGIDETETQHGTFTHRQW